MDRVQSICIAAVACTLIAACAIVGVVRAQPMVRSFRTGLDSWQVEYQYHDCWVTERYVLTSREFEPLYPKKSNSDAIRDWHLEHAEEMPGAANILLPEANPILPEMFNELNKGDCE